MIDTLIDIDTKVTLFVNSFHSEFFDQFMYMYSGRFIWVPMYATILYILFKKFKPKSVVVWVLGIALTILITDQFCASFMRPMLERLRPAHLDNPISQFIHVVNDYRGGNFGFPSCHAANSFALVAFSSMLFKKCRFVCFIILWAIINSYSRLYLGVHYLGDLLVGAVIGTFVGISCYYISKYALSLRIVNGGESPWRQREYKSGFDATDVTIIAGILTVLYIAIRVEIL